MEYSGDPEPTEIEEDESDDTEEEGSKNGGGHRSLRDDYEEDRWYSGMF